MNSVILVNLSLKYQLDLHYPFAKIKGLERGKNTVPLLSIYTVHFSLRKSYILKNIFKENFTKPIGKN